MAVFPEHNIFFTGFNTSEPPFDDPLVRRAFTKAVDVDRRGKVVQQGYIRKDAGFLPLGMPGYQSDSPGIPYDPAEAKRLLAHS